MPPVRAAGFVVLIGAAMPAPQVRYSPYLLITQALQKDRDDAAAAAVVPLRETVLREELDDGGRPKAPPVESDDPEKDEIDFSIQKLFGYGRYQFAYQSMSVLGDSPVFLVGFSPQPAQDQPRGPDSASRTEKMLQAVLNNSTGIVYIDQQTKGIVRFETHLVRTAVYATARVYVADITYEQQLKQGLWLPRRAVVYLQYSYLLGIDTKYRRFTILFSLEPGRR
jgi:hypothetical protein